MGNGHRHFGLVRTVCSPFRATMIVFLFFFPSCIRAQIAAPGLVVTGVVRGDGGQKLGAAHLHIDDSGSTALDRVIELSEDGAFSLHIGSTRSPKVTCTLSASGYESQRITAVINETGVISLGVVRLPSIVELNNVSVALGEDNYFLIDFWIVSHVDRPLTFASVSIAGLYKTRAPCFDSDPILTMRFTLNSTRTIQSANAGSFPAVLHVISESAGQPRIQPPLVVEGAIERESCGPVLVRLTTPYSFVLAKEDRDVPRKFRLEVPMDITVSGYGKVSPDWKHAVITAGTDREGKISGSPK